MKVLHCKEIPCIGGRGRCILSGYAVSTRAWGESSILSVSWVGRLWVL